MTAREIIQKKRDGKTLTESEINFFIHAYLKGEIGDYQMSALLLSIAWVMGLTHPLLVVVSHPVSGRDLILLVGGVFLIGKSTLEIHDKLEGVEDGSASRAVASFAGVIAQILLLDIVFSLDSVITGSGWRKR